MKWRVRKPGAKTRALCWWHKYFAIFPVRVPTKGRMSGMTMVWWQSIERKGTYYNGWADEHFTWEYRLRGDK